MEEFFADIFNWVESLSPLWAYLVILGISYGENVLPPIPGDMIVVFGGYLAGVGKLNFLMVWLLSAAGGALGFMTMYAIGYSLGEAIYHPDKLKWLPKARMSKVGVWVQRWGYGVVVANRFLSGARSVISLSVGIGQMDPYKTTVACSISALVWTGLIGYAGYAIGENWEVVSIYLRTYGWFIITGMVLFAISLFVRSRLKTRKDAAI